MAQGGSPPPVTYPHLGTLLVGSGVGIETFTATADGALPDAAKGILAGLGAAFVAGGLFLLGRAST